MIDHLGTYATDFQATKEFYRAVFEPLGYSIQMELVTEWDESFPTRRMCAFGPSGKPTFWIIETREPYTPRHIAFTADSRAMVTSFYEVGISAGGIDNGQPGVRPIYHEHYFGAFLLDPDGNNIEAVCHAPE